jgi:ABC-type multidrug transport system fused ATPase/permease subunit
MDIRLSPSCWGQGFKLLWHLIFIHDRLSTVKDADVIYVLSDERIVESGNYSTLLSLGGMYKRMCQAQELDQ